MLDETWWTCELDVALMVFGEEEFGGERSAWGEEGVATMDEI